MQVTEYKPKIVAFCCNWCSYAGADGAGSARLGYPEQVKIIRVPCSCRVNPMFILRAFQRGADGVIIAGTPVTATTPAATTSPAAVWRCCFRCWSSSALKRSASA